jgi:cytochrome c-type biogenesis protein CcmF
MKSQLGTLALAVGFAAAVTGAVVAALAARHRDPSRLRTARRFVFLVFASAVAAAAVMEWALLTHDFSLAYVAGNASRATPTLFTVTSLWAALQGSILLWSLILTGHLAFAVWRWRTRGADPLITWTAAVGMAMSGFFFALMLVAANPFRAGSGPVPHDGNGPNPLLQNHPMMAFHPPMLYLGYVGFSVPFAMALAALITGRIGEEWLRLIRTATLLAWGCLTGGIVLGAWWSYAVLGWGGYWAWDPVENAALIPWLTGTAFLHSVIVQQRRGMLRVWNLSLLVATYCLTILGTFLTRSGVVNSVHAFTQSNVGPVLLGYLAVAAVVGLGLIGWRGDRLRAPGRIDSVLSREAAFLGNNLVLTAIAAIVVMGTVFPLIAAALWGKQVSVGEPYFNRMSAPLGIALLVLMTVAPLLPYRAADPVVLRRRLFVPGGVAAATMAVLAAVGAHGAEQVLTFGLAAAAATAIGMHTGSAVHARRTGTHERRVVALLKLVTANRRHYGGLIVHLGVVIIAVALAASHSYSSRLETQLTEGASASLRGYTVTYLNTTAHSTSQKLTLAARLRVHHHGADMGVFRPSLAIFPGATEAIGTPAVRPGPVSDLYLTLASSPNQAGQVTVDIFVNPLVSWLWFGGLVMVGGTVLAGWPVRRKRRRSAAPVPVQEPAPETPVVVGAGQS